MEWTLFDIEKYGQQPLPLERRHVLLQLAAVPSHGLPPAVAVGYLRYAAGDVNSPEFTIPGIGGLVVAWCDCLGDNFRAPLWYGSQTCIG